MVLFGSLLDQFVSSFHRSNVLSTFEFDAVRSSLFRKSVDQRIQWNRGSCSVYFQETMIKIFGGIDDDSITVLHELYQVVHLQVIPGCHLVITCRPDLPPSSRPGASRDPVKGCG